MQVGLIAPTTGGPKVGGCMDGPVRSDGSNEYQGAHQPSPRYALKQSEQKNGRDTRCHPRTQQRNRLKVPIYSSPLIGTTNTTPTGAAMMLNGPSPSTLSMLPCRGITPKP